MFRGDRPRRSVGPFFRRPRDVPGRPSEKIRGESVFLAASFGYLPSSLAIFALDGRSESEFGPPLIPRKLLIPLNEKNAKNTQSARLRYTPSTRTAFQKAADIWLSLREILKTIRRFKTPLLEH